MGAFEHFPYTNFQDLNLNWIIGEVKKANDEVKSLADVVATRLDAQDKLLADSIIELTNEVEANLQWIKDNVQPIVNETINELIKSGEMYVGVNYIAETEELNIVLSQEV